MAINASLVDGNEGDGAEGGSSRNPVDNGAHYESAGESMPILKPHHRRSGLWRRFDSFRRKLTRSSQQQPQQPAAFTSSMAAATATASAAASSSSSSTSNSSDLLPMTQCLSDRTRRRCCFALIAFYLFLDGLEGGFIIPTLWLLLENKFHLQSDGYFLGFTVSSFCAASLIFSPVAGKFADLLKTAKPLLILSCLIRVASNALYFISYSKWFVWLGRLLSGVGAAVTPALIADVARATKVEERTKVINYIFILRNIGNVAGYMIIPLFSYVDFDFFGVRVYKLNASGFVSAILFLLSLFLTVAFYFDLSPWFEGGRLATNEHGIRTEKDRIEGEAAAVGIKSDLYPAVAGSATGCCTGTGSVEASVITEADDGDLEKRKTCCSLTRLLESFKKSWTVFAATVIRVELLIVFLAGFVSMFNLGSMETAMFPFLEALFNWTIFLHPFLFFGALLCGILLLILIFRIGQNYNERGFLMTILLMSCGATLFSGVTWTLALNTPIRMKAPQVMWELLVGGGAFLLIIFVNAVCILTSAFLSLIFSLESQGLGQGYLQTMKMIGNMLGPLWAGTWMNVPLFLGVQLGLLGFVSCLFGFSWDRMNPKKSQQQQQQRSPHQEQQFQQYGAHNPQLPPPPGTIQ